MLFRRQELVAKHHDTVLGQRVADFDNCCVGQSAAEVDPANFSAGGAGQWTNFQVIARQRRLPQ